MAKKEINEIGPREIVELPVQEPIVIPGYKDNGIKPDLSIDIPLVQQIEQIPEPTIYDKYNTQITEYIKNGTTQLTYAQAMEILRYCERKIGSQIPINMSCQSCVDDMFGLFVKLKH